ASTRAPRSRRNRSRPACGRSGRDSCGRRSARSRRRRATARSGGPRRPSRPPSRHAQENGAPCRSARAARAISREVPSPAERSGAPAQTSRAMGRRGEVIVFEGIEGTGKTPLAARLAARLRTAGLEVVETREPWTSPYGDQLRLLLARKERSSTREQE